MDKKLREVQVLTLNHYMINCKEIMCYQILLYNDHTIYVNILVKNIGNLKHFNLDRNQIQQIRTRVLSSFNSQQCRSDYQRFSYRVLSKNDIGEQNISAFSALAYAYNTSRA